LLRLGLLSTARINTEILVAARASRRVEVVAVASRDAVRAKVFARENGIDRAYAPYEALLRDPEVDAVYIGLPNSMHVEWSIRALEAGKHVICEKPLSSKPDEVERAFDAAERAGRLLTEAFMYRHHPQAKRVKELVEGGAIGQLRALRAVGSFDLPSMFGPDDIRLDPALGGGSLMDLGCYCVSGCRLLAGEPEAVYGRQVNAKEKVDISFFGVLSFPTDIVAEIYCSFALPLRQELEAIGDEGFIRVQAPWRIDFGGEAHLVRGGVSEVIDIPEADAYQLELENLADAIEGRVQLLLDRDDAIGQAWTIAALYRSAESGATVHP
jgi:D-xylose 1-dehydrogenase (NADP+, D-xylono-1,5-lactone-forming)